MSDIVLKYTGTGGLISVPARDLTEQDLIDIAWTGHTLDTLVKTGLYTVPLLIDITFENDGIAAAQKEKLVITKGKKEVKHD